MRNTVTMLLLAIRQEVGRQPRTQLLQRAIADVKLDLAGQLIGRPVLTDEDLLAALRLWLDFCRENGIPNSALIDAFNTSARQAAAPSLHPDHGQRTEIHAS